MFHIEDRAAGKDKSLTFSWGLKGCQVKNGIHFTHSFLHCSFTFPKKKTKMSHFNTSLKGGVVIPLIIPNVP